MTTSHLFNFRLFRSALVAFLCLLSSVVVSAAKLNSFEALKSHNEETFVFAGHCFSGERYRLFMYQKDIAGVPQSHYDYDGPVGKGTVQSNTPPKVMAARVCRKYAEIISASYWE